MFSLRTLFVADRRASVSVLGCMLMIGTALLISFVIELSDIYIVKMKMQRTADLAALAGTVGASPVTTSGAASTGAVATALNVATVNGFGSATVNTTGADYGNVAYSLVTGISETPTAIIGSWLGGSTPNVSSTSQVSMVPTTVSDCVASIGGTVQISSSATVVGSGCGVASQSNIVMSGGTLTAAAIALGGHAYDTLPHFTGGTTYPPYSSYMYTAMTTDVLASNSSVSAAKSHLASLATWPYPTAIPQTATAKVVIVGSPQVFTAQTVTVPANTHWGALTITGSTLNFAGSGGADPSCTSPTTISGATVINGSNTLNFASGCYIFNGSVTTDTGGSSVSTNFNVNSGATVVFYFQSTININLASGSLNFGNANTYKFLGNITSNNGGTFTVGTGTKIYSGNVISYGGSSMTFGDGNSYFNGSYIINDAGGYTGTMQFGNGSFYLWNGSITNLGSSPMNFGTGPYYFYNSQVVDGQYGQGGITFTGGDYYFYGGLIYSGQNYFTTMNFQNGNIDMYNGGNITVSSTMYLASGSSYSGGGTVSLYGGSVTITAGTLYVVSGTLAMNTGTLSITGGSLAIVAPTSSNPTYGHQELAMLYTGTNTVNFNYGTTVVGGMIYAPNSTVGVSNSATLQAYSSWGTTWCFGIAANNVTFTGTSTTSLNPCTGMTPTSTATAVLLNQ